jgi:hypothetical protein
MLLASVSTSTITSILGAVVVVGSALVFPWLQKKGVAVFKPRHSTLVVPGTRQEWLQRSCDALAATRSFSIVAVSDYDFELKAKFRRLVVWADLTANFISADSGPTRIDVTISVLPNLLTLVTGAEQRVLARFTRAIRGESVPQSDRVETSSR